MKAKMYLFDDKMEIVFPDETNYIPVRGEAKEEFVERIKKIAEVDYLEEEFEVIEIDKATVETNTDEALLEAVETAQGLKKKLIQEVLSDRKIIKIKPKKEPKATVTVEEAKASEHYKECEANVGKFVTFSPFKSEEVLQGKIVGVALSKTNTIVYYTVVIEGGKRKCCAAKNETLKFIDKPKNADAFEAKKAAKDAKVKETKTTSKTTSKKQQKDNAGDGLEAAGGDLM